MWADRSFNQRAYEKRNQPDKSITTLDAAMAKHVMDHGTGGFLSKEAIYYVVSAETGVHVDALANE